MSKRHLLVVAPLIVLAGCWPYLGGSFEDYVDGEGTDDPDGDTIGDRGTDDPDTEGTDDLDTEDPDTEGTQGQGSAPVIGGWVDQTVLLGTAGWSDPDSRTVRAIVGGVEDGEAFSYTEGLPSSGACVTNYSTGQNLVDTLTPLGFSDVQVTVPPDTFAMNAASDAPDALIGGVNTSGAAATNATVTVTGNMNAGSISGTLTRTPSMFSVDAPDLDGDTLATLPFGEFDIEYSGTLSDAVLVSITYLDATNEVVGGHTCLGRNGSVTANPENLGISSSDVSIVQVVVSRVRETSGSLGGTAEAESQVVGVLSQGGLFVFEDEPSR